MINIKEKKDHLIVKHKDFNSLPKEKQDWLINYFKSRDNPPEMTIDWLRLNNYDIEDIYKATLGKTKTGLKKAVKKLGIEGLKEGEDYIELDISEYTNTYKAYVPLHWEASKLIASSKIGGCEGKWCTAYQKNSLNWLQHTEHDNAVLIYLVNTKKPEKYAIKYYVDSSDITVWDSNDNGLYLESFEEITNINTSIFQEYSSILNKSLQKIKENNVKLYYTRYKDYLEGKKYIENRETLETIIEECPDRSKYIKKLKIDMSNLQYFFTARNLKEYDISEWDVSRVTSMEGLFRGAKSIGDISKWNVSNVKNMRSMFEGSDFNGDISQWDVSNVRNMSYMFHKSEFNGDISNWDVSNVINMSFMFSRSKFRGDISQWNVSNVKDMRSMFEGSDFNGDISQWDVSNVEIMSNMFRGSRFNGDISKWNVSKVINMEGMFEGSDFNGDISNWDVSNVEDMSCMFVYSQFKGDISNWNVSNVKNAYSIFDESPLQKKYPNGLEDLKKEQQRKKENTIKKFLDSYFKKSIMVHIEEKKDHLIVKHKDFNSLPKEKQEWLINYFKSRDNPPEMTIDWLKLDTYNIEDIYKATLEKSKTGLKKSVKKLGIEGLEEGKDYIELDISPYTNTYKAYIPLHWEASKLIASSKIGGCEGKWCTAYQKDRSYWINHTENSKAVLIYLVNTNKPEKYAIKYYVDFPKITVWDSNDKGIDLESFEEITHINTSIFHNYSSILKKSLQKIKENRRKIYYKEYRDYLEGKKYVEDIETLKQIIDNCTDPSKDIKKLKIGVSRLHYFFAAKNLEGYDISEWDVSRVTSMEGLFSGAKSVGDISKWDVSNVKNMGSMFEGSDFNGDISSWNVSNVKNMNYMFNRSKFNGDISNWDVSNVISMSYMFSRSAFNRNISKWNVSKVRDMSSMFADSKFNGDISQWNVSKVEDMNFMFSGSKFNGDISRWNVSKVINMKGMFTNSEFNRDISKWDVSNVIDMKGMFAYSNFNKDISNWDVSNVMDMSSMFEESEFNGDISNWDVSNVENMSNMFKESEFNGDVSKWDVSNVKYMDGMFYGSKFSGDISNWDVSNVENMNNMFAYSQFNGDISKWNVSNVKSAYSIFTGSPLEKRYPNGLKDLIKEQQSKNENTIKKFLDTSIWRDV